MNHFYQDSHGNWWFKIMGKDNKIRNIPVNSDMLNALSRYRIKIGLTALPSSHDSEPLLLKEKGNGAISSARQIRRIVQECFNKTHLSLDKAGFSQEADALENASAYWLRHTGIAAEINNNVRPLAHVRDDAGHRSNATTNQYNDLNLLERHQSRRNKLTNLKNIGTNINAADQYGNTALIWAANNGHTAIVTALLAIH